MTLNGHFADTIWPLEGHYADQTYAPSPPTTQAFFTCRPSPKAARKMGIAYTDKIDTMFFSNHKKQHGLNAGAACWADGMTMVRVSSINEGDSTLLKDLGLEETFDVIGEVFDARNLLTGSNIPHPVGYGDPAYGLTPHMKRKHNGAITGAEREENNFMLRPRAGIEDVFKEVLEVFPFFDEMKKHQLLAKKKNTFRDELVCAFWFYNMVVCVTQTSQMTGLSLMKPPSLQELFESVHSGVGVFVGGDDEFALPQDRR